MEEQRAMTLSSQDIIDTLEPELGGLLTALNVESDEREAFAAATLRLFAGCQRMLADHDLDCPPGRHARRRPARLRDQRRDRLRRRRAIHPRLQRVRSERASEAQLIVSSANRDTLALRCAKTAAPVVFLTAPVPAEAIRDRVGRGGLALRPIISAEARNTPTERPTRRGTALTANGIDCGASLAGGFRSASTRRRRNGGAGRSRRWFPAMNVGSTPVQRRWWATCRVRRSGAWISA